MAKTKSPVADVTSELDLFVGVLKGMRESAKSLSKVSDAIDIVAQSMKGVRMEGRVLKNLFSTPLISRSFISTQMTGALDAFAARLTDVANTMKDMKLPAMGGRSATDVGGSSPIPSRLPDLKGFGRFKEMDTATFKIATNLIRMNDEMGMMRQILRPKTPWNRFGDLNQDFKDGADNLTGMSNGMDTLSDKIRKAPTIVDKLTKSFNGLKAGVTGSIGFIILKDIAMTQKEMGMMVARFSNWSTELGSGATTSRQSMNMLTKSVITLQGALGASGADLYNIQKALIEGYISPIDRAVDSSGKLSASSKNFEDLTGAVYKMTQVTGASTETVAQYMKTLRMAGIRSKTTMKQIVTSFGGLEMSANDMDKMINSLDTFTKSVRQVAGVTGASAGKLANSFKGVTASVVKFGGSQEEASALMGMFVDPLKNAGALMQVFGVNAVEAGDALKTGDLTGLINKGFDTGQLSAFVNQMENVPVAVRGSMLAARGLSNEMYNAIVALHKGGKESMNTFADSARSQKALEKDFAASRESFMNSFYKMWNAVASILKTGFVPILDKLSVVMGWVAAGADAVASGISKLDDITGGAVSTTIALIAAGAGLLWSFNAFGKVLPFLSGGLSSLGGLLNKMLPNFLKFGSAATSSTSAAGSAATGLGETLRSAGKFIMDGITSLVRGVLSIGQELASGIMSIGNTLVGGIASMVEKAAGGIAKGLEVLFQGIGNALKVFADPKVFLGGVAAIVLIAGGIYAIGKAAEYAAPGLQVLGDLFSQVLGSLTAFVQGAGVTAFIALGIGLGIMAASVAGAMIAMANPMVLAGMAVVGSGLAMLAGNLYLFGKAAEAVAPGIKVLTDSFVSGMGALTQLTGNAGGLLALAASLVVLGPALAGIGAGMAVMATGMAVALPVMAGLQALGFSDSKFGFLSPIISLGEILGAAVKPLGWAVGGMRMVVEVLAELNAAMLLMASFTAGSAFSRVADTVMGWFGGSFTDSITSMGKTIDGIIDPLNQMSASMASLNVSSVSVDKLGAAVKFLQSLTAFSGIKDALEKANDVLDSDVTGMLTTLAVNLGRVIPSMNFLMSDGMWSTMSGGLPKESLDKLTGMGNSLEAIAKATTSILAANEALGKLNLGGGFFSSDKMDVLAEGISGFIKQSKSLFADSIGWGTVSVGKAPDAIKPLGDMSAVMDAIGKVIEPIIVASKGISKLVDNSGPMDSLIKNMPGFITKMGELTTNMGGFSKIGDVSGLVKPIDSYKAVIDSMSSMVESVSILSGKLNALGDLSKAGAKLAEVQSFMALNQPKVQEVTKPRSLAPVQKTDDTSNEDAVAQTVEQTIAIELRSLRDVMGRLIESTDAFVPAIRENAFVISNSINGKKSYEVGF